MSVTDFGDEKKRRIFLKHLFNHFLKENQAKKNQRFFQRPEICRAKHIFVSGMWLTSKPLFSRPVPMLQGMQEPGFSFSYLGVGWGGRGLQ